MIRSWLVFVVLIAAPASAADDAALLTVVSRTASGYIIPAYETLGRRVAALDTALDIFCSTPSAENRSGTVRAFGDVILAWAAVDFLRFGPMAQEGRQERFAFWPDVHGTGARQFRQMLARHDESLLQPERLAEQSAAVQGVPALEALFYGGPKALTAASEPEPFRCALAIVVTRNMRSIAAQGLAGWQGEGGWAALMAGPGPTNPAYRNPGEAMTEILRAALTGLEQLRDHRLVPALGETPEAAKAGRAPYNLSGQALAYMRASAVALERFVEMSGMLDLLPQESRWMAGSLAFEFANLQGALEAGGDDLQAALADPERRQKLVYAAIVLASLRDLIQNQFAPAAGLTPGFNSLDGD